MQPQEIAENVVKRSLRLGEGDYVLIEAWDHTLPLAEALAAACFQVGTIPTVTVFSDTLFRASARDLPERLLRQPPAPTLAAYDHLTATIWLGGPRDPAVFETAPPAKLAAHMDAEKAFWDKMRERRIRGASIASGFVTAERARQYGVDFAAWQGSVNDALTVDPSEMASVGKRVGTALRQGKQLRILGPGTDLTVNLAGRVPHVHDGAIDDEDIAAGNLFVHLPDGTVSVAPEEGTATGMVTFPFSGLLGKVIRDLRFTFRNGRVTDVSARENEATFTGYWEKASGDRDALAAVSIGINPRAKAIGGGNLTDGIAEGTVEITLGGNKSLGGRLDSSFHWGSTIAKARVEVDGRAIAENGRVMV